MGRKLHFKMGSFYRTDDRSGFPQRAENTRQEWTGLIVDTKLWEPRNTQDFVKGVKDDQSVPKPRPLPPNIFDGPTYLDLIAPIGPGAVIYLTTESGEIIYTEDGQPIVLGNNTNILYLNSLFGIAVGESGGVMMDNGQFYNFTFEAILSGSAVQISGSVPNLASAGNSVVNYTTHIPPLPYANLSSG